MVSLLFLYFFLTFSGFTNAKKCSASEFKKCVEKVDFTDGYSFNVTSPKEFKEKCDMKLEAVKCTKDYLSECSSATEYALFNVATGGKLKLVEDLCKEGTELNKAYFKHMDCWKKMLKDVEFCNKMFEKSQQKINEDSSLDVQLKFFHGCCSFDWLSQCKMKSVEMRCDVDAKSYMKRVSSMLGGSTLSQLCNPTINQAFTNCYELYGVDVARIEDLFSSSKMFSASVALTFFSLLLLKFNAL